MAGGVVFVGTDRGTIDAFVAAGCGSPTCAAVWSHDLDEPVTGDPAVANGHLYVGTGHATGLVTPPDTGHLLAFAPPD